LAVKKVNTYEAKTQFFRLLRRVELGELVLIAGLGKVIAQIIPAAEGEGVRKLGTLAGKFTLPGDFDAPLPMNCSTPSPGDRSGGGIA
jgi:antitoxin (DNA-binding transcriptional repressor) of toxin-antitoxin stability system